MSNPTPTIQLSALTIGVHASRGQGDDGRYYRQHTCTDPITKDTTPIDSALPLQAPSPISHLSTEILAEIFEHAITGETVFSSDEVQLQHLLRVCHHWHSVVMAYPRLWSTLVFTSVKFTELMLQRSKEASLVVKADFIHNSKPHVPQATLLALRNLFRIRVLHIQGLRKDFSDAFFAALMDRPAPLLESFHFACWELDRMTLPPSLFAGTAPRLRQFSVSRLNVPWCLPLLCNLTYLRIFHSTLPPSLAEFRRVLSRCPALGTLILTGTLPIPSELFQPPVCLPHLSRLDLTGGLAGCDTVIRNISFPCTTAITLHSKFAPELPHLLTNLALSRGGVLSLCRLRLEISSPFITAKTWTSTEHAVGLPLLNLSVRGPVGSSLRVICEGFVLTQILNLILNLHVVRPLMPDAWETILCTLQNLQVLAVDSRNISQLVSALELVPKRPVSLPGLRKLVLHKQCFPSTSDISRLEAYLLWRWEKNGEGEKPKLFTWVEARNGYMDIIQGSLGEVVEWDDLE
jgi:hypothetical protein